MAGVEPGIGQDVNGRARQRAGSRPIAVLVLAAGLGTRMKSRVAKVLHRVCDRPLIGHILEAVEALSPSRLVVVVGHQADEVRAACLARGNGRAPADIRFVLQAQQQGTGHAVRCAAPELTGFRGDVLIVYGDTPALRGDTLTDFVAGHRREKATLSLLTACFPDPTGYGRIVRDDRGSVDRIVEERDASPQERRIHEINPGIYCVAADFLLAAVGALVADNAQGEYYLTDIVGMARAQGERVWGRAVDDPEEVAGINTRAELASMEATKRREIVQRWMAAGVTFEDPATVHVGADVRIGPDTTIGPNVVLRGSTTIGEACRIDGSAYLDGARLGDRVHLKFGVVITDSEIGDEAELGPFCHIRPATRLAAKVKIGNFVETKKATLGRGTKANHLSYLGDVTIGESTNVGAGTITCNYDGFRKSQTVIGDRVQIGSDTQLVAPVEVGSDAYIGAGTTVTTAVPPGALAVSRVPQRNLPGWVERRRARAAREKAAASAEPAPKPGARPRAAKGAQGAPAGQKPVRKVMPARPPRGGAGSKARAKSGAGATGSRRRRATRTGRKR
jgi:bifunctional UDP-N-acetylglucosamine pyrophosphorylase/glucosamine-1-phosphate N-acetyltransferase